MFARSTTVTGRPTSVDDAVRYLHDKVLPALSGLDGWVGLSMLADRDSGRCIATTSWEAEPAMHDSESPLHALRLRYAEILGGRPEVQEWEIAVLHRLHYAPDGACSRVIWGRGEPTGIEAATGAFRTGLLPRIEDLPGFCSLSFLVDRETGRTVTAVVHESRAAMAAAADAAWPLREEFARQLDSTITEVAGFDLALAHLRVPETI
jgi:hypothetical protein